MTRSARATPEPSTVDDRAVENGDIIKLDFDGSVDGVPFDGGKAENYTLTIGSGSFIPGFEDQLIGAEIGEENRRKRYLPGGVSCRRAWQEKTAVFKCKVNGIKVKELPEARRRVRTGSIRVRYPG